MDDLPQDMVAHKFRNPDENFWNSLETSTVYFPRPDQLNDPYDCQIDLVAAFKAARSASDDEVRRWVTHARRIMELAATCGVFSVCAGDVRGSRERLMWCHYAGNHCGVCLTYQIPAAFADRLIGISPVHYGENAIYEALRGLDLSRLHDIEVLKPVITAFLTTKAREWEYESEGRLIAMEHGLVPFERSWLRDVCFGLRTPIPVRERVAECLGRLYPHCRIAEAVRVDSGMFDLEIRPVTVRVR